MSDLNQTEAELQAHLLARIRKALPLLPADITLEHHLNLKIGHSDIAINGIASGKAVARGRYDLLLKAGGKPLFLVELKAPDIDLTPADIKQGLSYARLHLPPVPLVLVTNGLKTKLLRAYDGEELDPTDTFANHLQQTLTAAALAATATEDAIRTLLSASITTWQQMLSQWSEKQIDLLVGEVADFTAPVAHGFEVPREMVQELENGLMLQQRILVVHGPPLSGITNTLVQLSRSLVLGPVLYIDSASTPDVLQFIANQISREISFPTTKDEVRGWLNKKQAIAGLVLVLDGLPAHDTEELLQHALQGAIQLVIGMSTTSYEAAATKRGKMQKTMLGRKATTYEIKPLSNAEFEKAEAVLKDSLHAFFLNGAQHSPELRYPRTLRVRAASVKLLPAGKESDGEPEWGFALNPLTGLEELKDVTGLFQVSPDMELLLQKLAKAFLQEISMQQYDMEWLAASWGFPSVSLNSARVELLSSEIEELKEAGYLSWFRSTNDESRLLIRFEELLTYAVAKEWASGLRLLTSKAEVAKEIERVLGLLWVVPLGELALALAIKLAASDSSPVLDGAINYLLARKPTSSKLTAGTRFRLLTTDTRITLNFKDDMEEEMMYSDIPAWVVLSYLAAFPMMDTHTGSNYNLHLFTTVGDAPFTLFAPRPTRFADVQSFHYLEIRNGENVLCWQNGIIEPIVQSLVTHLRFTPYGFETLTQWSIDHDAPFLGWRLLTAANILRDSVDVTIMKQASSAYKRLITWLLFDKIHK